MAEKLPDEALAHALQQMGIATFDQVELARAVQNEQAKKGLLFSLSDVLLEQGIVTPQILDNVAKKIQARKQGGIKQLGQYKLLKKLGEGGMGSVYLAEDTHVSRSVALKVLPKKLSPVPPPKTYYRVAYALMPEAAGTGVSNLRWIEVEEIERREDGSALVCGKTSNLFWAVQSLLHYGHRCCVLGGPEMVREMRNTVAKMAKMYTENE